jgi:antitoxin VapB
MAISIKDTATDQLARALAAATGMSITEAVKWALQEQLSRTQRSQAQAQRSEAMLAIGERAAAYLSEPATATDHADLLYDDQGLPK